MAEIFFNEKTNQPNEKQLTDALGKNYKHWETITEHVSKNYNPVSFEWKFYGKNYGWQLKTFLKKRNLFFLIPYKSVFKIIFVFGDKAVREVEQSGINKELIAVIQNAKKYAEGRGLSFEVTDAKQIADIKKLIEIKIKN